MNTEELLESIDTKLTKLNPPEEIQPERIRPVAIMTRERRQLGDLEKDFQQVLDSIKYDKRVPGLITRLADMHLREAAFGRAIILYEISLGLASEQVGAWTHMGLAYSMVGDPKDAISCLGSALAIEPENTLALVYLANAQLLQGDLEKCNENLDRVLQLDASMSRAMLVKGKYFRKNGEPDVAVTWLRRAIAMDPQFLPALMELGSVYLSLKKYKEAMETLDKAVVVDPEQAYALATLGDVSAEQHDLETAL
ncbi:MAG: tetratricopeptide repeat protein, partial [Candidatus Thorarchaeota archaeon]